MRGSPHLAQKPALVDAARIDAQLALGDDDLDARRSRVEVLQHVSHVRVQLARLHGAELGVIIR